MSNSLINNIDTTCMRNKFLYPYMVKCQVDSDPLVLYYCLSSKYADQSIHKSTGISYTYDMTNNGNDINLVSIRTMTNEEGYTIFHETEFQKRK